MRETRSAPQEAQSLDQPRFCPDGPCTSAVPIDTTNGVRLGRVARPRSLRSFSSRTGSRNCGGLCRRTDGRPVLPKSRARGISPALSRSVYLSGPRGFRGYRQVRQNRADRPPTCEVHNRSRTHHLAGRSAKFSLTGQCLRDVSIHCLTLAYARPRKIVCRSPLRSRERASSLRAAKPTSASRFSKTDDPVADQTASRPPGFNARRIRINPRRS